MSPLSRHLEAYLALRRRLGFKLRDASYELHKFVRFAQAASHRDTFRLLLSFAQKALKKAPADLALSDLDAPFIGRFLDHVEKDRGNKPQTRNIRLAAIHSFFHYVALQEPSLGALAQRILAIPSKRHKTKPVDFLTREEIDALPHD
jgi:integrase/recombinase XerD